MRYLKYSLALLLLAALIAGVALHLKRESIARGIANDVLAGSGLRVTDLSIARLRPDEIRFSRLVLEQDDGARYVFSGLYVPLSLPDTTIRDATVERLELRPAPLDADPPAYTELLDVALALPARFPDTSVAIGELVRPGWPAIGALRWHSQADSQQLALTIAGVPLRLRATGTAGGQRLAVAAVNGSADPALEGEFDVARARRGYRAEGTLRFALGPWLDLAAAAGLPAVAGVEARAAASATVTADIETGGDAGAVSLAVRARLHDGGALAYAAGAGGFAARVEDLSSLDVDLALPAGDWRARAGPFAASVSHPLAERIEASIASLDCGPDACRLSGTARVTGAAPGTLRVGTVEFRGTATASLAGDGRLSAAPERISAADVRGAGWQLGALDIREPQGLVVEFADGRFGARADGVAIDVENARAGDALSGDAQLRLDGPVVTLEPPALETRFELPQERLRVAWRGTPVVPARLSGRIDYAGADGRAEISVADRDRGLAATVGVRIAKERLTATIDEAALGFGAAPLSASFHEWPRAWDLVGGTARAAGRVEWTPGAADGALAADVRVVYEDGAAAWGDLGATGIHAVVPLRVAPGADPAIGPAEVRAALVDVGLPLEDVRAGIAWDTSTPEIRVDGLTMGLLGGTLSAEPFAFDVADMRGALTLSVDAVQLGLIPELANFEALEVTGALSGAIPVRVDGGTVTVDAGHLENEPPGGVIRYRAQTPPQAGSGLALAQRALSNLEYESLASDVTYTEDGDLVMKLRLEGTNPDMDPLQPVILNLTVENNVPQLLKSLQATRDIQDVIESWTRRTPPNLSQ